MLAWTTALLSTAIANAVIIDVQPREPAAAVAIVASCNGALGDTRCSEPAVAVPIIPSPTPAPAIDETNAVKVRVELSDATLQHALVRFSFSPLAPEEQRELQFSETDPLAERYRAIGLVIAARVLELEAAAKAREDEEASRRAAAPPPPPIEPRDRKRSVRFDLGALAGPGLDQGGFRFGGIARASLQIAPEAPISALLALRVAARSGEPEVLWTTPSIGLSGAIALGERVAIELRLEAAMQRIDATAREALGDDHEHGSATRYGGAAGAELAIELSDYFGLFVGAETTLLFPRFALEVAGRETGAESVSNVSGLLGLRVAL